MNDKMRSALTILAIGLIIASSFVSLAASQSIATRTITETTTKYTTTTTTIMTGTKTLTTTITHTHTEYITRTLTRTITLTKTKWETEIRITTSTVTTTTMAKPGPNIRISSVKATRSDYRPGEYIELQIGFKNIGDPGNVVVCYLLNTLYLGERWITRCATLGYMESGETKYITENTNIFATCAAGHVSGELGCKMPIYIRLYNVNGNPPSSPSEKSVEINVRIDDEIALDLDEDYIIKGLRKGEARSYDIYLLIAGGIVRNVELTVKRLDGGFFDWDEEADLLLNHYEETGDTGRLCYPNEPLRIYVKQGWKKFEVIWVRTEDFSRDEDIINKGFKAPWDHGWNLVYKICV